MISASMFQNSTLPVLEQVLNFSQARHNVLAGNIANLDTPGYRVRDLSPDRFQELLREAIDDRHRGASASITGNYDEKLHQVSENLESILYHDDSNVSIEHQIAEMSKNQLQHNMALSIMTSQFQLLRAAISERA